MTKDKFLRGAMILTLAGLMVKIIGSVNRILLSRLLGGEGIGLYQMAYPVYLLMLSVSSAGIPIAISTSQPAAQYSPAANTSPVAAISPSETLNTLPALAKSPFATFSATMIEIAIGIPAEDTDSSQR